MINNELLFFPLKEDTLISSDDIFIYFLCVIFIVAVAWLVIRIISFVPSFILSFLKSSSKNNLETNLDKGNLEKSNFGLESLMSRWKPW